MKILLINGSPEDKGVIDESLNIIANEFKSDEVTKIQIPTSISSCSNCRFCKTNKFCIDDFINKFANLCREADILVFGSPVYYGGITSELKAVLTKLFYSCPKCIELKPIGTIVSSRRCGSLLALSELNAFFLMHSGIIVGSTYWNEIHGDNPQEMDYDYEGKQTFINLAHNLKYVAESLSTKEKPIHDKIKHINYISREYLKMVK